MSADDRLATVTRFRCPRPRCSGNAAGDYGIPFLGWIVNKGGGFGCDLRSCDLSAFARRRSRYLDTLAPAQGFRYFRR